VMCFFIVWCNVFQKRPYKTLFMKYTKK
jgi:hypothetical protein